MSKVGGYLAMPNTICSGHPTKSGRAIICAALIHYHFPWKAIVIYGLLKECSGRGFIAFLGEHEINGVAKLINSAV